MGKNCFLFLEWLSYLKDFTVILRIELLTIGVDNITCFTHLKQILLKLLSLSMGAESLSYFHCHVRKTVSVG